MPKTMKQQIKKAFDTLSEKEKKVAKYVIENYQQSMLLSSTELAHMAGVSDTTVIRYAKSLGYKGFIEYKKRLKAEYIDVQKVFSSLSIIDADAKGDTIQHYFNDLLSDLCGLLTNDNIASLDEMAKAFHKCKTLYLVGFGSDQVVVNFLNNYLPLMGIRCVSICNEGLSLVESFLDLSSEDVVFMSAFPTLMNSDRWVAKFAKQRGAPLIVISDSEITAKHLEADIFASFNEKADNFFNSYVMQMAYCNALLIRIYELFPEDVAAHLKVYQDVLLAKQWQT